MHFYKQPRRIQYLFLGLIVCIFICKIPTLFYVLYWSDYFTGVFCVNLLFCFVLPILTKCLSFIVSTNSKNTKKFPVS